MNFGQKALQVLRTVAPTAALALGGPFGPIAALAVKAALGVNDDKAADHCETAIEHDRDRALKAFEFLTGVR